MRTSIIAAKDNAKEMTHDLETNNNLMRMQRAGEDHNEKGKLEFKFETQPKTAQPIDMNEDDKPDFKLETPPKASQPIHKKEDDKP